MLKLASSHSPCVSTLRRINHSTAPGQSVLDNFVPFVILFSFGVLLSYKSLCTQACAPPLQKLTINFLNFTFFVPPNHNYFIKYLKMMFLWSLIVLFLGASLASPTNSKTGMKASKIIATHSKGTRLRQSFLTAAEL